MAAMGDGSGFTTPEAAAEPVAAGETIVTDYGPDGRWAVVVRRQFAGLAWVLCRLADRVWEVEDVGAMERREGSFQRSTWISVTDDDDSGPNLGVEIAWGAAPEDATRVALDGEAHVTGQVEHGGYWLVRWKAPDPTEDDGDTAVRFDTD